MNSSTHCETQPIDDRGAQTHVLVFRALRGLGDILCVVPSLRHIRRTMPRARISFMGLEEVQPLLARFPEYVDEFLPFPGHPGLPEPGSEKPSAEPGDIDLALQLHGDGSVSNGFVASLGAKAMAAAGPLISTECLRAHTRAYDHSLHEIERCLQVTDDGLRLIGEHPGPMSTDLELPLDDDEREEARTLLARLGLLKEHAGQSTAHAGGVPWRAGSPRPFVVLHPGSYLDDRRWPAGNFIRLGNELFDRGMTVLVSGSGEAEAALAEQVVDGVRMRPGGMWVAARAVNIAGKLSLGGLAALLQHSAGLITNDTGVSHVAAAVKTPSVVVFMASDAPRWAPMDKRLHAAVVSEAPPGVAPDAVSPEGKTLLVPSVEQVLESLARVGMGAERPGDAVHAPAPEATAIV